MKAIWKFDLEILESQEVRMPEGARVLSVENQMERLVLYALVDTQAPKMERTVHIRGTGHPIAPRLIQAEFIGTVKMVDGALMWHVFA